MFFLITISKKNSKDEEEDDFDKENEDFFEKAEEPIDPVKEKKVQKLEIKKKDEKAQKTTVQPFQKMLSREKVERRLVILKMMFKNKQKFRWKKILRLLVAIISLNTQK